MMEYETMDTAVAVKSERVMNPLWILIAVIAMILCLAVPIYADYFSGQIRSAYLSISSSGTSGSLVIIGTSGTSNSYLSLSSPLLFPANPTGLTMLSRDTTSILLGWHSADRAVSYVLRYSASGYPSSPTDGAVGYSGSNTQASIMGLLPNARYYFAVWAVNASDDYSLGSSQYDISTMTQASNLAQVVFPLLVVILIIYGIFRQSSAVISNSGDMVGGFLRVFLIIIIGLALLAMLVAKFYTL